MAGWNYGDVLEAVARAHPSRTALIHGGRRMDWAEFDQRAARLAAVLEAGGLRPGDVVAEYMRNGTAYLETFFAASKAALAPMNTNYRYVEDELEQIWTDADVKAVVYDAEFRDRVAAVRERLPGVRVWLETGAPYEEALAAQEPRPHGGGRPDSLVLIYTGGTTGRPKGVMWRQDDLLSMLNAQSTRAIPDRAAPEVVAEHLAGRREIRSLIASPLMHGAGLFYALSALSGAGTVVTVPGARFSAEALLDALAEERVQGLSIVGDAFARPLLDALDAEPRRWDLSALRVIFSSGAIWSGPVKEGLLRHIPKARLVDGLGSSEASSIGSTVSVPGDVAGTASFRVSERGAVLHDDGTLATPGDGRIGRLAVSGWLPVGYLNDPAKSAEVFVEAAGRRWSVPGDLAVLEADGRIKLLGRGSSCINTGGEKVFAEEVEEAVKTYPGIVDAAVLGVPDERLGAKVVAFVVTDGREADAGGLQAHVRARLAGYKVPRRIARVDSLDRLANGKLDHRLLARRAERLWGTARA
ncbi:AMP-binding protein [Actinomadura sp. LD22]|uniref:AMP-binding protein n=1 Tax=Actinomadura physcomitrii TaxID=2650748 RepID=A0A6I4MN63_9ACTN|nr:AMP-binding protein [Actinomadura physcomitrii]MWA07568.1 AMP-binding protein [Actinomadura physcomitrii]